MSVHSELTALREAIDAKLPEDKRGKKTISQMTESLGNIQNGSGTFDMVTVTKYTPAIPAGKIPEVINLTGFTNLGYLYVGDDDWDGDPPTYVEGNPDFVVIDAALANGRYEVTPETKDLEERHRIYRHISRPYIELRYTEDLWADNAVMGWTITNPFYTLARYGDSRGDVVWFLGESDKSFIGNNWWCGHITGLRVTVCEAVGSIENGGEYSPDIPAVIEGYRAISYNNGKWSFRDTISTFSKFDEPPEPGNIYAATGNSLIGKRVDALPTYASDSNTILMIDFENGTPEDLSRFNHEIRREGGEIANNGYVGKGWNFDGGWLSAVPNIVNGEVGTEFVFGNSDFTWEAYVYPTSTQRQCLFAYGEDYVFGVCFSYENNCKFSVFGNTEDWHSTEFSESLQLNKWYHVAIVRKGHILYCFINFKYSGSVLINRSTGAENNWFSIGRWGGDPGDFDAHWQGYMDEIRISNIARYEP